ncbi:MAG: hypothetical protein JXO22_01595 [Phycisphaerae bacterium]|nr:hypothetical protein [Phycisphaerae bacterium]
MLRALARLMLRLSSGLGLLLLIAAQERVCPWLDPPAKAEQQVAVQDPAATPTDPEEKPAKRPRLTLSASLPDVALPRRSSPSRQATHEPVSRRHVGVAPRGSVVGPTSAGPIACAAHHGGFRLLDCLAVDTAGGYLRSEQARCHDTHFAIGSTILRLGPPA